jgi:hypothetical protein
MLASGGSVAPGAIREDRVERIVRKTAKYLHLFGLALFVGSILTFAVTSGVSTSGDLPSLAAARRVISAGTFLLTLPALGVLVASGIGLLWGRTRLAREPWLRLMLVAAAAVVLNALLVVVPAVRSATALAQVGAATGHLPDGYARAFSIESAAGGVNLMLALAAAACGVWRFGAREGEPA